MDWKALSDAYPEEKDTIRAARLMRERMEAETARMDVPRIERTCRDMDDLSEFAPLIAGACTSVWKDVTGKAPAFDMAEALATIAKGETRFDLDENDTQRLLAVARLAYSLLVKRLRERHPHLVPSSWSSGDCPFCGEQARIGFDDEDRRTLECVVCGHSWRFPRLTCPFCLNNDHTSLGYFEAEGLQGVRVYFCRKCSHYVKIVDRRKRPSRDAETEDSITLELDHLAQREGFS
ncbi:MAG TPA: formate dehydrogenase accessory protein FdhE [Deltaproteobacteria bacterium]|nr:formate dehydrogenase accessory protein FdhE [Deltaproteobacteria bacterium]HPP81550.1 formate dehydrogenase accessory protein FdhE [Deltaproteobacteria bacterium]